MLDPNLLMRRAVRYACDQNGLTVDSLKMLSSDQHWRFQELAIAVADDMRYNQLRYFRPFEHQKKFFATSNADRRGILAANRIGKTVSTCFETAMHLTGQYPNWWTGKRFEKPITAMVAGEG